MSFFPIIELVDRYTIAKLKFNKTAANQAELDFYAQQLAQQDISKISVQLDRLYNIHQEIWKLEAELKSGLDALLTLEEIGRRAIEIRNWNHLRIELKNSMAEQLDCAVREIKRDHLMAFLRKFYRPENIVISIAGNFESYPSLKQHLEKGFSSAFHRHFKGSNEKTFTQTVANLEKYQTEWINVMNLVPYSFKQTKINHHISRNDIEHTFVVIGFQGFKYLDDQKFLHLYAFHRANVSPVR
jgi:hypothetical protein